MADRQRAILKDLAGEANVAVGTVSRALRNLPGVGPDTRKKILALAEKHQYVPNAMARALISGKTNLIGLVTPSEMHATIPFESFSLMQTLAEQHGKRIVHLPFDTADYATLGKIAYEQQWAGIILSMNRAMVPFDSRKFHNAIRIPVVGLDCMPAEWDMDTVTYDRAYGVRLILDHAVECGVRSVGLISYEAADLRYSLKYSSLSSELRSREISLAFCETVEAGYGPPLFRASYQAMKRVLAGGWRADLVMGQNDTTGLGIVSCLRDHGLRVPEDVAVTGYDDSGEAQYAVPALTTVQRPADEMIQLAWSFLEQHLAGTGRPARRTVLLPRLVARESTGKVASSGIPEVAEVLS